MNDLFWMSFLVALIPLGISVYTFLKHPDSDRWQIWVKLSLAWVVLHSIFGPLVIPTKGTSEKKASQETIQKETSQPAQSND